MRTPSQWSREAMTTRVAAELSHKYEERFGEILGFIAGDGHLNEEKGEVSFANSEIFCINRMLENFEVVFSTPKEKFNYYLTVPFDKEEKAAERAWIASLRLSKKISVHKDKRKKLKKELGFMDVRIHDQSIARAISEGLHISEECGNRRIVGFLRGFFAAEGAIIPGKIRKEVPNSIQFPQKGQEKPELIRKMLSKLGIECRVVIKQKKADYYCANITGFENFEKLFFLGIADIHEKKREKLRMGLVSYKKIMTRKLTLPIKLLRALNERSMTRLEIYKHMKLYPQKVNGLLYSKNSYLVKNKLINKEMEGGVILWKISAEGQNFLERQE